MKSMSFARQPGSGRRSWLVIALSLALGSLASSGVARAEEGFEGELEVTLKNAEYVKLQINGVDSDSIEFARNGKLAIIKGFDLQAERTSVTLIPTSSSLAPVDLDVAQKDFKRVRKGRVLRFVATRTVTFPKAEVAPEGPRPTPTPPADPVAPPPPDKDDL